MQDHLDSDAKDHVAMLDDLCLKQKSDKQDLEEVQAKLKSKIVDLEVSLSDTAKELSDTEQDLDLLKELSSLRIRDCVSDSDCEILVSNLPYNTIPNK